jgi:hypothetical protein
LAQDNPTTIHHITHETQWQMDEDLDLYSIGFPWILFKMDSGYLFVLVATLSRRICLILCICIIIYNYINHTYIYIYQSIMATQMYPQFLSLEAFDDIASKWLAETRYLPATAGGVNIQTSINMIKYINEYIYIYVYIYIYIPRSFIFWWQKCLH